MYIGMQYHMLPCRWALSRQFHTSLVVLRSSKPKRSYLAKRAQLLPLHGSTPPRSPPAPPRPPPSPEEIRTLVLRFLPSWISAEKTRDRLSSLGIELNEVEALLSEYKHRVMKEIRREQLTGEDPWSIAHLLDRKTLNELAMVDRVLTMRFFIFCAQQGRNFKDLSSSSLHTLQRVNEALDMRYPPEVFPLARRLRRKIYLHVGPTNSGKTYNALRALADASSGVYAGPLRLLAHEVWERLNRGLIRPLGTDPADAHLYARPCNLVTGEEHRVVSESANLVSCTVEMINLYAQYSVAVIDEIQMIADPERGYSWTSALLGVSASEVHLCGEEAVVPLIKELVQETGDELEVKYYERLTPLVVDSKSLEGRWDRIQKGDCVVTFSRSSIFSLKRLVEEKTGLRCAVAYGRLPPETRSEQATLFNSPNSGYDVLVASDAIGMGLNLKIKRIVFVELTKFNGIREVPLSFSQIKQIGGRAGRFGGQHDDASTGTVTCLSPKDLPILVEAFERSPEILRRAYLPLHFSTLSTVAQFFPQDLGVRALHSLLMVAARIGKNYSLPMVLQHEKRMEMIDHYGGELKLFEKMKFVMAPISGREPTEMEIFGYFVKQFVNGKVVDLQTPLEGAGLLSTLERVNRARLEHDAHPEKEARGYRVQNQITLGSLETLHRALVAYSWLSLREPLTFNERERVMRLKEETEKGIEFILEGIAHLKHREKGQQQAKSIRQLREESVEARIPYEGKTSRAPAVLKRVKMGSG